MAEDNKCPHCGKPVPSGAPGGLCPECMVKVGIGSEAATAGGEPKRPASPPPSPQALARLFPQLEILELLGSGGMGAVYKARQREIDRLVALKILPPEAGNDPGFAERFTREARALARLNHPNIVALHDFGHVNGLHYFIMEFVDGLNLRQLEQAGRLSPREALQIIPQICDALQFAHDEGIVHRDIKPENVLLDKKGRVKIADFGLARILGHEPEDFRLTRAREVMGTPHYMAPEQVEKPQSVDHRADIYSLGVVFYEMLTGELPLGKFAPPSQKVQIDVRLDEVVLRALEKEPARRYQHASEVKTDMETIMTHQPALATSTQLPLPGSQVLPARFSRVEVIAATGVVVALVGILAWVWKGGRPIGARKSGTSSLSADASPERAAAVPSSPAPGTNADSVQSPEEEFARRYGLQRPAVVPSSPAPGTNIDSAQSAAEEFARRYGLQRPAVVPSNPAPGTNTESAQSAAEEFARRYGLGPEGLVIRKLTPLFLKITLDEVAVTDSGPRRYKIAFQNEAPPSLRDRLRRQVYGGIGITNKTFTLRDIKASPDNPTNDTVVLELSDTGQRVEVAKDHPFQRIEGYMADLKYGPEIKRWSSRRVGSVLSFARDEYQIMAVTRTAVVLRQKSNNKTWAVEFTGAPAGQSGASPTRR